MNNRMRKCKKHVEVLVYLILSSLKLANTPGYAKY